MKTIVGITIDYSCKGNEKIDINPYIFEKLDYAKGSINTKYGLVNVSWKKERNKVGIKVSVPENVNAYYKGKLLRSGKNEFVE